MSAESCGREGKVDGVPVGPVLKLRIGGVVSEGRLDGGISDGAGLYRLMTGALAPERAGERFEVVESWGFRCCPKI